MKTSNFEPFCCVIKRVLLRREKNKTFWFNRLYAPLYRFACYYPLITYPSLSERKEFRCIFIFFKSESNGKQGTEEMIYFVIQQFEQFDNLINLISLHKVLHWTSLDGYVRLSSIDICVAIETSLGLIPIAVLGLIDSEYVTLGIKKENR